MNPSKITMQPEDFGTSLTDQARHILRYSIDRNGGWTLDRKSATWLIRSDQRARLFREVDAMMNVQVTGPHSAELLGIRVRWTTGDDETTPELQLVMEPQLSAPR